MDSKKKFEDFLDKMQGLLDNAKKQGHIIVRIEDIENTFPELKESEDEKIRKGIIRCVKGNMPDNDFRKKYIAWLEKQDVKQSLSTPNERAWLYLVADVLTWKDGIGQYLDDPRVQQLAKKLSSEYAQKLYNKQETYGKVGPKFKIGDWVVYDHRSYQVVELPKEGYINLGLRGNGKIEFAPSPYCRHWTIKDAKDGDVLVDEDNNIGLYLEEKDGLDDWESHIYLGCDNHLYGFSMGGYHNIKNTKPATKEQSDLLFQKMKEKGYKWDAEKKALKEIELHDSDKIEPKFKVGEWA